MAAKNETLEREVGINTFLCKEVGSEDSSRNAQVSGLRGSTGNKPDYQSSFNN